MIDTPELTLTAVICTRNRADWIARSAGSLARQRIPGQRFEVLVVDNGSSDSTAEEVFRLQEHHPIVRYAYEEHPGLSHARNRALLESCGDIVAFLDDDAIAEPDWAFHYLEAFADAAVAAAGGRIRLAWPGVRPWWVPPEFEALYTCIDLGDSARDFPGRDIPYGANVAVRRAAVQASGHFSPDLSRRGGRDLTSGEERELLDRLRAEGGRIRYVPTAEVTHHVLPARVSRRWLWRRAHAQGRTEVLMQFLRSSQDARWRWTGKAAKHAARATWRATAALPYGLVTTRGTRRLAQASHSAGVAQESLRVAWRSQTL